MRNLVSISLFTFAILTFFHLSLSGQSLVNVNPDSAYRTQNLAVTISGQGTHFGQGSNVTQVWLSQVSVTTIYPQFNIIQSSILLDAHFTIPQNANLGLWDVNVWTDFDGHMQMANGFLIYDLGMGITKPIQEALNSLEIFPHPVVDNSRLRFTLTSTEEVIISIYDLKGKKLTDLHSGELAPGTHTLALNKTDLAAGTYVLKVGMGAVLSARKIVVR